MAILLSDSFRRILKETSPRAGCGTKFGFQTIHDDLFAFLSRCDAPVGAKMPSLKIMPILSEFSFPSHENIQNIFWHLQLPGLWRFCRCPLYRFGSSAKCIEACIMDRFPVRSPANHRFPVNIKYFCQLPVLSIRIAANSHLHHEAGQASQSMSNLLIIMKDGTLDEILLTACHAHFKANRHITIVVRALTLPSEILRTFSHQILFPSLLSSHRRVVKLSETQMSDLMELLP